MLRYVDLWLWARMVFVLVLIGACIAIFYSIVHQLVLMFRNWLKRRRQSEPASDFYQHIAEQAIAGIEEQWRAKQR